MKSAQRTTEGSDVIYGLISIFYSKGGFFRGWGGGGFFIHLPPHLLLTTITVVTKSLISSL